MVVPYRHIPDYTDLDPAELAEFSEFTRHALTVIRTVSAPHGFNIGINAGAAGGAGIAPHLHQHLVPRWGGDANFMPVIGADQGAAAAAGRHPGLPRRGLVNPPRPAPPRLRPSVQKRPLFPGIRAVSAHSAG
ncbi:MAG: HIT domain-containing protein [Nakamurella multipartita]